MVSLTATILKSSLFTQSTTHGFPTNPITRPVNPAPHTLTVTANVSRKPQNMIPKNPPARQNLYQPFRPPSSPVPPQFRSLDSAGKIEILAGRLALWFEYAPLISSLYAEGLTPPNIEELTGISSIEQNRLIVGTKVRDSIAQSLHEPELIAAFDTGGAELLYEIRLLSTTQRVAAATYIIDRSFDSKKAQDLARAIKDYPSRRGDVGWVDFDYNLPGDCLAFLYYRQSRENKNPSEQRTSMLQLALDAAESEKAKKKLEKELHGGGEEEEKVKVEEVKAVTIPVVRLKFGEVAGASSVVVLPVCKAEEGERNVVEAPREINAGGEFKVVEAERGWKRWVVLPSWKPVAAIGRGGVAVSFRDDRKVLPDGKEEPLLVVVDRERSAVEADDGAQSVGPRLYSCCNCRNHVGLHDDIISKAFQGRTGRAFLFSHAMNVVLGAKEDRNLLTGLHTVADISCADCNEPLGWKYERAYEASQKYKEGKFIFEKAKIVKEEDW